MVGSNVDEIYWACPRNGEEIVEFSTIEQSRNFLNYVVQYTTFQLKLIDTTYCYPRLTHCTCKSLLKFALHDALDKNPAIDRISGYFDAKPWIRGCRCYLGVASNLGFNYVQLKHRKPICNEKTEISPLKYVGVCESYKRDDCHRQELTEGDITKI